MYVCLGLFRISRLSCGMLQGTKHDVVAYEIWEDSPTSFSIHSEKQDKTGLAMETHCGPFYTSRFYMIGDDQYQNRECNMEGVYSFAKCRSIHF